MSETVFILGAGASAQAGAPLMNNFFDEADKIKESKILSSDEIERFTKLLPSAFIT